MNPDPAPLVLITDYAWPDLDIERDILAAAGLRLAAGPGPLIPPEAVTELVRRHLPAAILTNWAVVNRDAIAAAPGLRHVGRLGVGLDNIDVAAATAAGAWVTNIPDYCVEEVSDHAIGLLLGWARGIVRFDREVQAGLWQPDTARLRRVGELTIALLGVGRIGGRVAEKLSAFGCRLLGVSRSGQIAPGLDVQPMALEDALAVADAVIITLPGTPQTRHLINASRLAMMRRGAVLINVGRGSVVETDALVAALESGHLGGACLDVFETEPDPSPALLGRVDVILTPHIAFTSDASLRDMRRRGAEEAARVLTGAAPESPCNQPR